MHQLSLQKILLASIVICGLIGITYAVARAYERISENKVEFKTIQEALDIRVNDWSMLRWNLDDQPEGRKLGAGDAYMLGRAYTEAMLALTGATASGFTDPLKRYFTGTAFDRAEVAVRDAEQKHQMIVLEGQAKGTLFHLDGSLIQLATRDVKTVRFTEGEDLTAPILISRECQSLTMFNQTTGWRIGQMERLCAEPISAEPAPALLMPHPLIGINYYPRNTPWHDFWPQMQMAEIEKDFRRIRALGGNALRIFLQFEPFNDVDQIDDSLIKFIELLDTAQQFGLTVIPTLFDLRSDYRPNSWAQSWSYMNRILRTIDRHPAVHIIDIKNEPDRDFEAHGKRRVLAWLETMARLGRDAAPHLAFTIGWAEPEYAPLLKQDLGVISYHDYQEPETIGARYDALATLIPDRPILVTEIGWHSWQPIGPLPFPSSEQKQSDILTQQMQGLSAADGRFIWTLHDFTEVPNIVVGPLPWRKAMQKSFGLLHNDGTPKPAAFAFSSADIGHASPFTLPDSIILLENLTQ